MIEIRHSELVRCFRGHRCGQAQLATCVDRHSYSTHITKKGKVARDVAQRLRTHTALVEDLSSILSIMADG